MAIGFATKQSEEGTHMYAQYGDWGGVERSLYISILPVDIDTGRIRIDVALGVSCARRRVSGDCSFQVVRTNPPLYPQFLLSAQLGFF